MTSPKSENSPVLEIVARPSFGLGEIRGPSAPVLFSRFCVVPSPWRNDERGAVALWGRSGISWRRIKNSPNKFSLVYFEEAHWWDPVTQITANTLLDAPLLHFLAHQLPPNTAVVLLSDHGTSNGDERQANAAAAVEHRFPLVFQGFSPASATVMRHKQPMAPRNAVRCL